MVRLHVANDMIIGTNKHVSFSHAEQEMKVARYSASKGT
jgi:hypothetical protein